jgi:hypothetical protein
MMRTILTAPLGLVLTAAVLLAGCGKGDAGGDEAANDPAASAEQGADPGSAGPDGAAAAAAGAACRFKRRASCTAVRSRSWGGNAASAISPSERW